jgi:hypothetical protein
MKIQKHRLDSGRADSMAVSSLPTSRHAWRGLRLGALCGNLLYVVGAVTALTVLASLDSSPWQAYANLLIVTVVPVLAVIMNLRAIRAPSGPASSGVAILLNLICLWFLLSRPEYAHFSLNALALSVPLLNVAAIIERMWTSWVFRSLGTSEA